jgi:hypothetical protein
MIAASVVPKGCTGESSRVLSVSIENPGLVDPVAPVVYWCSSGLKHGIIQAASIGLSLGVE